jgi:ElaB/YqjD/DUF883 family membrane-anchored ribosome-binding protein
MEIEATMLELDRMQQQADEEVERMRQQADEEVERLGQKADEEVERMRLKTGEEVERIRLKTGEEVERIRVKAELEVAELETMNAKARRGAHHSTSFSRFTFNSCIPRDSTHQTRILFFWSSTRSSAGWCRVIARYSRLITSSIFIQHRMGMRRNFMP